MSALHNPTHSPSKHPFDLSHRKIFTAKAGELLPILCEEVIPNDYFEIDTASLIRSCQPLQTAAFMRCKVCFDFFFVPSTAIWSNFNAFYTQRQQQTSSLLKDSAYEPNMTLYDLYECCMNDNSAHLNARLKTLELLGYGHWYGYNSNPFGQNGPLAAIGNKSLSILPIGGYNLIYNMHYRNAWRDVPTSDDRMTYNLDWLSCSSYMASLAYDGDFVKPFVNLHRHGWPSDLFMGSMPNSQFGTVSTVDSSQVNPAFVHVYLADNLNDVYAPLEGKKQSSTSDTFMVRQNQSTGSTLTVTSVKTQFDVVALRKAMAFQKWKEQNARAGWKLDKQMKAMFGVDTPKDRKHEIDHIASYECPIMVDEVVSTADTNTGSLGELGGKAIAVKNGEKVKFSADERHGYLYCICYIMPQTEYDAVGIDPMLVRSEPFDRFTPAFENIQMKAIQKFMLNAGGDPSKFSNDLGYAPGYFEYKTKTDKVYCNFVGSSGQLRHWVTPRIDLETISNLASIPTEYFYVSPSVLDNVFAMQADDSLTTDQFMLNVNFITKATRGMSVVGLPSL